MKNILTHAGAGFLGGVLAIGLLFPTQLEAKLDVVKHRTVELFNNKGKQVAYLGPHSEAEQGSFFINDSDGKTRIQMGTYPVGSEKSQSLIGLHDRKDYLRFLFRLHGANDSPTIVMKDKSGTDKMIIGLDGQSEEPYIKYMNDRGEMVNLIE